MSTARDDATAARSLRVLRVARRSRLSLLSSAAQSLAAQPCDEWWELIDPADDEDLPPLAVVLIRAAAPGVRDVRLLEVLADEPLTPLIEIVNQTVARLRRSNASLVTVSAPTTDLREILLEVGFVALPATGAAERLILQL